MRSFQTVRSKRQSRRTYWPLKTKTVHFFETSESDNLPTQRHIPEELSPQQHIYIYIYIYKTSLRGLVTLKGAAFSLPTPRKRSEYSTVELWICYVFFACVYTLCLSHCSRQDETSTVIGSGKL